MDTWPQNPHILLHTISWETSSLLVCSNSMPTARLRQWVSENLCKGSISLPDAETTGSIRCSHFSSY